MELGGVEKGMGGGRGGAMSGGKGCRGGKKEQEVESGCGAVFCITNRKNLHISKKSSNFAVSLL